MMWRQLNNSTAFGTIKPLTENLIIRFVKRRLMKRIFLSALLMTPLLALSLAGGALAQSGGGGHTLFGDSGRTHQKIISNAV